MLHKHVAVPLMHIHTVVQMYNIDVQDFHIPYFQKVLWVKGNTIRPYLTKFVSIAILVLRHWLNK